MTAIYTPNGRAREFSPLALNIYNGCSSCCKYCYCRNISKLLSADKPTQRKDILKHLENQLKKSVPQNQVLLSFVSDIYCEGANITRPVLELLCLYQVPVAILTKNKSVLKDLDLFKQFANIKIGMTLTFTNAKDSKEWEPGASLPQERAETLQKIHKAGIKTFASLEPVIKPEQSLDIIRLTHSFVDMFKVGKLNNYQGLDKAINWADFGEKAVNLLIGYKKDFYIKKDLVEKLSLSTLCKLKPENTNADFWALKNTVCQQEMFV